MKQGSRVRHGLLGEGTVIGLADRGFRVQIQFKNGIRSGWLKVDDVIELERPVGDGTKSKQSATATSSPAPITAKPSPVAPPRDEEQVSARRLIEALRLGIVPHLEVARFTFGRDREKREISDWLANDDDNFRLIVGEYGSGKTHFLECMKDMALESGFAVALISLDPSESPLFRPKRVYHKLMQSVEYLDRTRKRRGLREFLLDAGQHNHPLWTDTYLTALYTGLRKGQLDDTNWQWISGSEVEWRYDSWLLPRLYDETTASNIYCHILSSIATLARDCVGLKGLVLLFDEAETIDFLVSKLQLQRGINLFRALFLLSKNTPELSSEAVTWGVRYGEYGGVVETGYIGETSQLRYSGRGAGFGIIRFTTKQPIPLKVAFGFAPAAILDEPLFQDMECLELATLSPDALADALKAASIAYASAYDFRPPPAHHAFLARRMEELQSDSPRSFVKAAIEAFDLMRHYPDTSPQELLAIS